MRRALQWWVVAVLMPLLPLGTGQGRALYRCAVDGLARSHCCCPARTAPQAHASLKSDCCDIERGAATRDARAQVERLDAARVHAPVATAVWQPPRRLAALGLDEPPGPRVAPAIGPPILLAKRSLLL